MPTCLCSGFVNLNGAGNPKEPFWNQKLSPESESLLAMLSGLFAFVFQLVLADRLRLKIRKACLKCCPRWLTRFLEARGRHDSFCGLGDNDSKLLKLFLVDFCPVIVSLPIAPLKFPSTTMSYWFI